MRKVNLFRTEDFGEMHRHNAYYVDKTGFLENFLRSDPPKISVFALPRRFGKGMMLTMLDEFFNITRDSRELFAGLKIAENAALCAQWMNRFPVLRMTLFHFLTCQSVQEALFWLWDVHADMCREHTYLLSSSRVEDGDRKALRKMWEARSNTSTPDNSLACLTRALAAHHGRPVIVLIDDYDFPFVAAAEYGLYKEMHALMSRFLLSPLQQCPDCLHFCVFAGRRLINLADSTGKKPFPDKDIKTYDIFDSTFSRDFGFASDEVDRLLEAADLVDTRKTVHAWYGGHRLGDEENICCLWATRTYLRDVLGSGNVHPRRYWLDRSRNLPIRACCRQLDVTGEDLATLLAGAPLVKKIHRVHTAATLAPVADNLWSWLLQLGYLARAPEAVRSRYGVWPNRSLGEEALVIANLDARSAFVDELGTWFQSFASWRHRDALASALWQADTASFVSTLDVLAAQPIPRPADPQDLDDPWIYASQFDWDEAMKKTREEAAQDAGQGVGEEAGQGAGEDAGKIALGHRQAGTAGTVCLHALLNGCLLELCPNATELQADRERRVLLVWKHLYYDRRVEAALVEIRQTAEEEADLAALADEGLGHLAEGQYGPDWLTAPAATLTLAHWSFALCGRRCAASAALVKGA